MTVTLAKAPRAVVSCKQLILEQFSVQEGLAHEYGSVTDENGRVRASVVVHAPEIPGRRQEKTHTFYGEHRGDLGGALAAESAAEVALCLLCDEYDLDIDDLSYSAYLENVERVVVAHESFRESHARRVALQQELTSTGLEKNRMLQRVKDSCLEYGDVLPVRAGPSGVEYVGPPSPTGGLDKLALNLVQFLQSANVE